MGHSHHAHGHGHQHSHGHAHVHTASHANKHRLKLVLCLTTLFLIVEVIGGIVTQSLALLADAAHMLTDVGGLALALLSIRLAERPATPEKTYGYYRAEILAALANAVVLICISFYIFYEAYERFKNPVPVHSPTMLVVACIGLAVNVFGLFLLHSGSKESLNLRAAYLEVFSDALASLGVITAAIIIWTTGWQYADPIISIGISLFIFPRTWRLLSEAVGILLEGTPADVNLGSLRQSINSLDGVSGVHDLHVWALASGVNAMSVHVVRDDNTLHDDVLLIVQKHVTSEFKIAHLTVQVESKVCAESETHL